MDPSQAIERILEAKGMLTDEKEELERAQAVDSFREKYVHGNVMEADFEAMLNAIWDDDYEAHVLMFLYGAGEREKMLS